MECPTALLESSVPISKNTSASSTAVAAAAAPGVSPPPEGVINVQAIYSALPLLTLPGAGRLQQQQQQQQQQQGFSISRSQDLFTPCPYVPGSAAAAACPATAAAAAAAGGTVAGQVAAFVLSSPPDLHLHFGGVQFAANKIVLAACSKVRQSTPSH